MTIELLVIALLFASAGLYALAAKCAERADWHCRNSRWPGWWEFGSQALFGLSMVTFGAAFLVAGWVR